MLRRTSSLLDNFTLNKLKDLIYFRDLLGDYDLSVIRDFLQTHLEVVRLPQQSTYSLQLGYRHVSVSNTFVQLEHSQQTLLLKQGTPTQLLEGIIETGEEMMLIKLSLKTELIFTQLHALNLPLFSTLKSCEKLTFLAKCEVINISYGGFVYRRGEPVNAIFWLLSGQVKIFKNRNESLLEIGTVEKDRLLGLYCVKHQKTVRELSARCSQNGTQVLVLHLEHLQELCLQRELSLLKFFQNIRTQLYSVVKFWPKPQRVRQPFQVKEGEHTLKKRILQFQKEREIKNKYLDELIQTKTLLYKIRDVSTAGRKRCQPVIALRKKVYQRSRGGCRSSERQSTKPEEGVLTPQPTNTITPMMRSFVGLCQSSSVRRYLHSISRD